MSKILFVGAGLFQLDGILKAQNMGCYTIAVDGNPKAEGKMIADEFYHIDVTKKDVILDLAKRKKIDGVLSIASEISLETVSYIVSEMKLIGYNYNLVQITHDKKKYYHLFKQHSINVPETIIYKNQKCIDKLDNCKLYYIKPSKGSGSRGVKLVNNITRFDFNLYRKKYLYKNEDIIIQQRIEGKEMTIDGFIIDEIFYLLAVSEEINDQSKGYTFSSELIFPPEWINKNLIQKIIEFCGQIIKCFNFSGSGPIHLELIFTPENKFYIIDFSLRGGGFDVFTKIIEKTSGIDVLDLYIKTTIGKPIIPPNVKKFNPVTLSFVYPDKAGVIKKINGKMLEGSNNDYFLKFLYNVGESIAIPESGKQRAAYYICWGKNYKSVFERRDFIKQQISLDIDHE